jgi:serine/threonine protein kinase
MAGASGQSPDVGGVVRELPGYRIERQLGRGSMGVVYLAEDMQLRRKVALKILAPTLADDELFRKRFDRESQNAANLDHPNIVPVYAAGEAAGALYIAMRYVSGGDLRALIEANGPLSLAQATSVIVPVADALDAAHAQGMVHRDVKPANILFDGRNGQEHYYLSDFGITKIVSPGQSLTSTGQIVGTIDYIAPEQIQGKPVDGRADLYALGCVLYHCLTGVVPFPREEIAAFMWAHVHEEAPPVTARRPDLPPEIDRIVAKAMAKQPEDRYATCRELALALRAVAADPAASAESGKIPPARPIDSPPPTPVSAGMTSTYTPLAPAPARLPATTSSPGRKWWWWAACGVLALALIGGSTAVVLNYLSSRFPNEAERALLDQVPVVLKKSCTRSTDTERDTANVLASVTCTANGDANTIVFTKFTSHKALDDRYNAAVVAAGIGQNSGDCLSAERAEGEYKSESSRTHGRALCYQQRGSSVITWTEDGSQTLGSATWTDPDMYPDYAKLRRSWAGVVGLKLPTPEPAQTPPPAQPPAAAPVAPPAQPPAAAPVAPPAPAPVAPPDTHPRAESVKLDGPTPAAPGPQQSGSGEVPGPGGCTGIADTSKYYACTITKTTHVYQAGTTSSSGDLAAAPYPFLCQSDGPKYSDGNHATHWWAWVVGKRDAGWVPVVFLADGPDNAPQPGLPVCDSAPTTTTTPPTTSPGSQPARFATINTVGDQTRRCLSRDEEGGVAVMKCDNQDRQKWEFPGNGTIQDKQGGRCLSSDEEGGVAVMKCDNQDHQKWDASKEIILNKQTGRCLSRDEGGNVSVMKCNKGNRQKWGATEVK